MKERADLIDAQALAEATPGMVCSITSVYSLINKENGAPATGV